MGIYENRTYLVVFKKRKHVGVNLRGKKHKLVGIQDIIYVGIQEKKSGNSRGENTDSTEFKKKKKFGGNSRKVPVVKVVI